MPECKEPRGMSAAQACRPVKRTRAPSDRSPPRTFTIRRDDVPVLEEGTMKQVRDLFPGVKPSLLTRRLDSGERDFDRLARPPESPASRKKRMSQGVYKLAERY